MTRLFTNTEYKELLIFFKKNNYNVINFKDFFNKYSCHKDLENKIVLLRHDIHGRDIENAYKMIEIEKNIFGKCVSTFFVQWKFMGNSVNEYNLENRYAPLYERFVKFCIDNNIDVQPHIAVLAYAYKNIYNRNDSNIKNLNINICYECQNKCLSIKPNEADIEIEKILNDTVEYIENYINEWEEQFKFRPLIFSSHGDGISLTKKINTNKFGSLKKIENIILNANSPNILLGKKSKYNLDYKCDNGRERLKTFYDNISCQFELLVHPYVWTKY